MVNASIKTRELKRKKPNKLKSMTILLHQKYKLFISALRKPCLNTLPVKNKIE